MSRKKVSPRDKAWGFQKVRESKRMLLRGSSDEISYTDIRQIVGRWEGETKTDPTRDSSPAQATRQSQSTEESNKK
ncbi:hypothetical protein KQX54_001581 [Cotesia glomerata]|uniref:Uncharacterized protein n=1 Tax=Cotesia glomerata TaxID=32391 RepID=A0AAV7IBX9_COTGL|nr:hypothetical protein KQX54_001581 [Cotesia glomerata]